MDDEALTSKDEAYFAVLKSAPPGPPQWRTSTDSTIALGRRMRRRRHLAAGAGSAAVALVAVFGSVSLTSGSDGPTTVITDPADAPGGACRVPADGPAPSWLGDPAAEAVLGRLQAALDERFGVGSAALAAGLIGRTTDHASGQAVVVVDGGRVDRAELQDTLRARAGVLPGVGQDWLEVRTGCHTAADLVEAERYIDGRTWMREDVGYAFDLDARSSTFRVTIPAGPAADVLREHLRDLVSFDHSEVVDRAVAESLDTRYDRCAKARGFDPGGVQVLLWEAAPGDPPQASDPQPGQPWWVKTGRDVPAEVHRPCLMQIGGPDPRASSRGNGSVE